MKTSGFYPPEGSAWLPEGFSDWVPTQEIRDLKFENSHQLRAQYFDRVTQLRMNALVKLMGDTAIGEDGAWAFYMVESPSDDGSVMSLGHVMTETALLYVKGDEPGSSPRVRTVRRELYRESERGYFVIQDALVDGDGDTYYMIDGIPFVEDDIEGGPVIDIKKSLVPIHASYGDNLYLVNGSPHPTLAELRSDYDGRVLPPATPLGRHDNHIDNDFVISMMNHFISELDGKEPYKTSLV